MKDYNFMGDGLKKECRSQCGIYDLKYDNQCIAMMHQEDDFLNHADLGCAE